MDNLRFIVTPRNGVEETKNGESENELAEAKR